MPPLPPTLELPSASPDFLIWGWSRLALLPRIWTAWVLPCVPPTRPAPSIFSKLDLCMLYRHLPMPRCATGWRPRWPNDWQRVLPRCGNVAVRFLSIKVRYACVGDGLPVVGVHQ